MGNRLTDLYTEAIKEIVEEETVEEIRENLRLAEETPCCGSGCSGCVLFVRAMFREALKIKEKNA